MMIKKWLHYLAAMLVLTLLITGCGSMEKVTDIANKALETVGIRKPEVPEIPKIPDIQKAPRTIQINLHASNNLNLDDNGRSLALVARIYKLRQNAAFQQASYDMFLSPQKEKELLGADLIEVKEITLVPGQQYQADEKVSQEAYFIGIIGLFRTPAKQRWRATFPASEAEKSGITLGMHECAITVGKGQLINPDVSNPLSLSTARCQ